MDRIIKLHFQCLVLLAASLLMSTRASATHIFGIDLYYTYVSGNTYTINMAVYGDCSAASSVFTTLYTATPEVQIINGNFVTQTVNLNPISPEGIEVTPVCANDTNNTTCTNVTNTVPGVRKFTYSRNVTLSGPSANWVFHFDGNMGGNSSAGRSSTITNILTGGSSIISLDAQLNNVTAANSSSVYTTIPTPFFCDNVPANFNPGAVDPNGDSLSFALVPGIDETTGSAVNYVSPYTATQPLAVTPGSFIFNSSTGQLTFTPNLIQRSLVVYTVSEYRNGILVGTSQREMTVVTLACNNTPPTGRISNISASGPGVNIIDSTHLSACGNAGAFSFHISPLDSTTNVTITAAGVPAGATFNVSNNTTTTAQGIFAWNTTGVAAGTYTFYITFKSDACPLASTQTVAYSVIVSPTATPSIAIAITDTTSVFCAGAPMHFAATATNTGTNPYYQWKKNGINVGTDTTVYTNVAAASGDVITCVLTSNALCLTTNTATSNAITAPVHSSTIPVVTITDNAGAIICSGTPITFTASAIDTATAATYQWERNGVAISGATNRIYIDYSLAQGDTIVCVVNSNAPVCAIPGTSPYIAPTVFPAPDTTVTTSGLIHICLGDSVTLQAAGVGTTYQWQRNGVNINGANATTYTVHSTGNYAVYVSNTYGCAVTSSVVPVTISPVPPALLSNIGGYLNICTNDSLLLGAPVSYTYSYVYQWYWDGNVINGATSAEYTTRTAGAYQVTVSDNQCLSKSNILTVTTIQAPVDTLLSYGQTVICPGGVTGVTLAGGTASNPESYLWYRNGTPIQSATRSSYLAPTVGTYTLKITDTTNGCSSYSKPVSVTSGTIPDPSISYEWPSFQTGLFSNYQWYYNNVPITGATSVNYAPTQSGVYTVMVTDANGCIGTSANYYFAYSGVGNVSLTGSDVRIYPNPANDIVYINAPVAVNAALYAMDSRLIQNGKSIKQLDISELASGVYMITITDENNMVIKKDKLVKN
ncbi:MAG: T9SS type A sorting domain-containing protein [Flavipsychrobacter sp.]|nr:T9SS type A sorting domain-containing protein [Flavipsychrobacter sp.]